jgi:predicted DNA-binding transcriptional regulator YafY
VHDGFSIFYYQMRITDDLVAELLSYGSRLQVISPPELKAMLVGEYTKALSLYEK